PQDADKYTNVVRNIQAALEASGPDVLILHDDQFALTGELPVTHAGPIGDHLRRGGTGYNDRLRRTAHYVGRDALAYDTHHMPLRADRDALAATLATLPRGVLYRTVYGHVARLGGDYHDDVKIRSRYAPPQPGWSWCSTSDDSFARGEGGGVLRGRYPDPGPHEGDA